MDNKSAFKVSDYDDNVRKVIPFYDEIYNQVFDLINTYFGDKSLCVLDTGCGSGNFGVQAVQKLNIKRLLMCDPSEKMLIQAENKLKGNIFQFKCIGSENISYNNEFDVVVAIQSHHYFDRITRKRAVENCFKALKSDGLFICFENTAPFSKKGKEIILERVEKYGLSVGRSLDEVISHSARYNNEYFPINIKEHINLLNETGFNSCELLWCSYMQCGFYAIKK